MATSEGTKIMFGVRTSVADSKMQLESRFDVSDLNLDHVLGREASVDIIATDVDESIV